VCIGVDVEHGRVVLIRTEDNLAATRLRSRPIAGLLCGVGLPVGDVGCDAAAEVTTMASIVCADVAADVNDVLAQTGVPVGCVSSLNVSGFDGSGCQRTPSGLPHSWPRAPSPLEHTIFHCSAAGTPGRTGSMNTEQPSAPIKMLLSVLPEKLYRPRLGLTQLMPSWLSARQTSAGAWGAATQSDARQHTDECLDQARPRGGILSWACAVADQGERAGAP
jgi:hypothetical protein